MSKCSAHEELFYMVKDIKESLAESRKENMAEFSCLREEQKKHIKQIENINAKAGLIGLIGGLLPISVLMVIEFLKRKF